MSLPDRSKSRRKSLSPFKIFAVLQRSVLLRRLPHVDSLYDSLLQRLHGLEDKPSGKTRRNLPVLSHGRAAAAPLPEDRQEKYTTMLFPVDDEPPCCKKQERLV